MKLTIASLLLITACSTGNVDTVDCGSTVEQAAFVNTESLWTKSQVNVCWINPTSRDAEDRYVVQNAVQMDWDDEIGLDFVGWGSCLPENQDIRILINDVRPNSRVGETHTLDHTMVLNFGFENWMSNCKDHRLARTGCITYEANHEMGHALGFQHEQERSDTPAECKERADETEGTPEGIIVGPYDPNSIMNYCGVAIRPSCQDISAAQGFYGKEPK